MGTHAEYSVGPFTPDVEAGIGNSSAFANHVVKKAYTAVGEIANFQAGTNIDLPRKLSLDVELYEAMPMQLADIFGTISRRSLRSAYIRCSSWTSPSTIVSSGAELAPDVVVNRNIVQAVAEASV